MIIKFKYRPAIVFIILILILLLMSSSTHTPDTVVTDTSKYEIAIKEYQQSIKQTYIIDQQLSKIDSILLIKKGKNK